MLSLYEGTSIAAHHFRYALLIVDILIVIYIVTSTFFSPALWIEIIDVILGIYLLLDFGARLWIAKNKAKFFTHPLNITDLIALGSFLSPLVGENFGFLRALRILRLLRSYHVQKKLRQDFAYFHKNEDIILSATNLFIFIFIMTEIVFVTQSGYNPHVNNFLDALYFTIATLTTTGFGDVTLSGQGGRIISIVIMIFGVSLFLRLIHAMFRPAKVRFNCDDCGLFLHESDAVHCKHCGKTLNIPSDGAV
ncbi:MAG TPA: ion transporter [Rhodospirillaceae bacterium]|nr:ion transporter [Rhodospirillaceae bacterium]